MDSLKAEIAYFFELSKSISSLTLYIIFPEPLKSAPSLSYKCDNSLLKLKFENPNLNLRLHDKNIRLVSKCIQRVELNVSGCLIIARFRLEKEMIAGVKGDGFRY